MSTTYRDIIENAKLDETKGTNLDESLPNNKIIETMKSISAIVADLTKSGLPKSHKLMKNLNAALMVAKKLD